MSTLSDLVEAHGIGTPTDIDWLHLLGGDTQILADFAFADLVLWAPTTDGSFIAVGHARPSSAATLFYRDFVGQRIRAEWRSQVASAYENAEIIDSSSPAWYEETPTRVRTVPVVRPARAELGETESKPIAVISLHTNLSENRSPSRHELMLNACAVDLFDMVAAGAFPILDAAPSPRRGAPRPSDGTIRIDTDGIVTFASPNAMSAFTRLGFPDELEGEILAEVTSRILSGKIDTDEALPVVVTGRAAWRADIETRGVTISLRAIPTVRAGERTGAIILSRDVTEQRSQELELITKDATIREIHHRVKNNLQTVASLLRIQARRTKSDEAREALTQAMRRIASIALVHDTLSEGLTQNVDFDEVFNRVLMLSAEVAAIHGTTVHPRIEGTFGVLPSEYATPLALALTELVTNAVEHGLAGREGSVLIAANRTEADLSVHIIDDGAGLPTGDVGDGLGTQIVKTLIQGELSGTIEWNPADGGGTDVSIDIPLRFLTKQ